MNTNHMDCDIRTLHDLELMLIGGGDGGLSPDPLPPPPPPPPPSDDGPCW